MNAQEVQADMTGDGSPIQTVSAKKPAHEGDWGHLAGEPCRFCRRAGGVFFLIDEGPEGIAGLQVQRCDLCGRSWQSDSALA